MTRIVIALLATTALSTATLAQHVTRGLDLVNRSHAAVASFFASNAGQDRWDEDLLDRRGLQPNHFVQLDLDDPTGACRYDFKWVFADGTTVVRRNIDVCARRAYALTD